MLVSHIQQSESVTHIHIFTLFLSIRQEMARVNIDILGTSELKWMGMGEFNSDDHYIYYCRQDSLRRNGVALIVNKIVQNSVWVQSQKRTE